MTDVCVTPGQGLHPSREKYDRVNTVLYAVISIINTYPEQHPESYCPDRPNAPIIPYTWPPDVPYTAQCRIYPQMNQGMPGKSCTLRPEPRYCYRPVASVGQGTYCGGGPDPGLTPSCRICGS